MCFLQLKIFELYIAYCISNTNQSRGWELDRKKPILFIQVYITPEFTIQCRSLRSRNRKKKKVDEMCDWDKKEREDCPHNCNDTHVAGLGYEFNGWSFIRLILFPPINVRTLFYTFYTVTNRLLHCTLTTFFQIYSHWLRTFICAEGTKYQIGVRLKVIVDGKLVVWESSKKLSNCFKT